MFRTMTNTREILGRRIKFPAHTTVKDISPRRIRALKFKYCEITKKTLIAFAVQLFALAP